MGHVEHTDAQGTKLPSVSAIPGIFAKDMSGFEDWICRGLHDKTSPCCTKAKRDFYQESADLGNDIHALREAFLRGKNFEEGVPEYQAAVFEPVAKFYKESGYEPLELNTADENGGYMVKATELKMTGKEFGGTLDGAGTFSKPFWEEQRKTFWDKRTRLALDKGQISFPTKDSIWVDDLKVKSALDILHPLQLHGYFKLLNESYGVNAPWGLIIRREKKLDKKPEIQLRGSYLPLYDKEWNASMLMWRFLNAQ